MLDNLTALLAVPHPGICEKLGRSIGPEHFRTLVKATKCEHRLAPGEVGTVLVLVASKSQASTVFGYCLGLTESSLLLRQQLELATAAEIRLAGNIVIAVRPRIP